MRASSLLVDAAALAICLMVFNPSFTGVAAHEWVSLVAVVLVLAHVAMHGEWFANALRGAVGAFTWRRAFRLILNVITFVAFAVCVVSGIFISGTVLPMFGLYATGFFLWEPLHAASAKLLLGLLLIHVALNARSVWSWLKCRVRRDEGRPRDA